MHYIPQIGSTDSLLVTNTVAVTGKNLCAIQIIEDTIFTVLTGTIALQGALADATFKAGTVIFGNFTAFTLSATGAVIAYNAKD